MKNVMAMLMAILFTFLLIAVPIILPFLIYAGVVYVMYLFIKIDMEENDK